MIAPGTSKGVGGFGGLLGGGAGPSIFHGRPGTSSISGSPGIGSTRGSPGDVRPMGREAVLGSFKKGGTVPKDGAYQLEKGEKVTPVAAGKRDSEYRRVYLGRKKKDGKEKK